MRILGRISTAVQCVQNGKICGNFHIKGLVITDLYTLLDTHCAAGIRPAKDTHDEAEAEESDSSDELNTSIEDYYRTASGRSAHSSTNKYSSIKSLMSSVSPAPVQMMPLFTPAPVQMTPLSSPALVPMTPLFAHAPAPSSATPALVKKPSPIKAWTEGQVWSGLEPPPLWAKEQNRMQMLSVSPALVQKSPAYPDPKVKPYSIKSRMPFTPFNTVIRPRIIGPSGGYDHWRKYAEGKPIDQSQIDGVHRVVNLTGGNLHDGDMLRVGDWTVLEDPTNHQARQVILANIRRAAPDRACLPPTTIASSQPRKESSTTVRSAAGCSLNLKCK